MNQTIRALFQGLRAWKAIDDATREVNNFVDIIEQLFL